MNPLSINWYQSFNYAEAILWVGVAVFLLGRIRSDTPRQRWARWAAAATFVVFGLSDWLEAGRQGRVPLWLYAMKVACGASIFLCRFTWLGWRTWHWLHREFLFALFCIVAVSFAIWFQYGRG